MVRLSRGIRRNTENEKKGLLTDLVDRELFLKQPNRNPIGFTYKTN
jgi:hypothetical protein